MTTAVSPIKRQQTKPYLTLQEYKNAPTALDYGNIVAGANQAAQDAELSNAILRASSHIDQYCNQIIGATVDTEQQRTRIRPDGSVIFHPKYSPIIALTSLTLGTDPNNMSAVADPSKAWMEEQSILYPYANANLSWSSAGPLSFGAAAGNRAPIFVNYSYVNGYFNSTIGTSASAGATSITMADGTGLTVGEQFTIFDGANTETVTVASTYTFDSNTVPLTAPLAYAHSAGVSASSLPAAIKQACILLTSVYLKIRGDASLVMAVTTNPSQQIPGAQKLGGDVALAEEILKPFRRIR
jgi:hypothetical protein